MSNISSCAQIGCRSSAGLSCVTVAWIDRQGLQSLERVDEPWVYAVLEALAELTGEPVVCNTSFNRRGEPILNTAAEVLSLLCEEPELGYVVVEDALFEKCAACPGACSDPRDDL